MHQFSLHRSLFKCVAPFVVAAVVLAMAPLSVTATSSFGSHGNGKGTSEYGLKAAFLYNFAKYTTWPKSAFADKKAPILVTVVGKDPFGKILDQTIGGKKVGLRPFKIERISEPAKVKTAHILFLGSLKEKERRALMDRFKGKPVLVIADQKGLAGKGALAGFYLDGGKVRFEISTQATKANGLTISSQLLKLAKLVDSKRK